MFPMQSGMGKLGAGSAGYPAVYTDFDGTGDYFSVISSAGLADDDKGTLSLWYNPKGGDGTRRYLFANQAGGIQLEHTAGNKIRLLITSTAPAALWDTYTDTTYLAGSGLMHIFAHWDLSDPAPTGTIKINGVAVATTESTAPTAGTIDYTAALGYLIGAAFGGGNTVTGCLGELYCNMVAEVTDITKFSLNNKPVFCGAQGELPSGSQAAFYMPDILPGTNVGYGPPSMTGTGNPTRCA